MSNRRRPRNPNLGLHVVTLVDDVETVLANLDEHRCPDCDSWFGEVVRYADQVASVQVHHSQTCPWWRAAAGL